MPGPLEPDGLYHLATPDAWDASRAAGEIAPPSLVDEGFVHCSWGRQVAGTVAKHFAGAADVLALRLDVARVADDLIEEDSYGSGQAFPHVYRPIPTDAVTAVAVAKP
ncbi:MAG: DUF952 domain-containing protein [Actinobacteria bacterium]|nr:DUF952 domain-containing protein [Actinomycetota bacterium]